MSDLLARARERLQALADKREAGLQADLRHLQRGGSAPYSEAEAREHATVTNVSLADLQAILSVLSTLPDAVAGEREAKGFIGTASGPCNEGFRCVVYFDNPESAHALAGEIDATFSRSAQ